MNSLYGKSVTRIGKVRAGIAERESKNFIKKNFFSTDFHLKFIFLLIIKVIKLNLSEKKLCILRNLKI